MAARNEDVLIWTLEGVDKGAEYLLIVKDSLCTTYSPIYVMPGESLERKRKIMSRNKFIEDGINIYYAKEYFENIYDNSIKHHNS